MKYIVELAIAWDDHRWTDCNFVTVEVAAQENPDDKMFPKMDEDEFEKKLETFAIAKYYKSNGPKSYLDRIQKIWIYSYNIGTVEE